MTWLERAERLPGWVKAAAILGVIAALGYIDYLSGFEISFSIFYLVPVVAAAWVMGAGAAALFAVLCAGTWLVADVYSGHLYTHPLIPAWNAVMRLGVFLIVSYSQVLAKRLLQKERKAARYDYLTGIMNGRGFYETAQRAIDNCRDLGQPYTLAYIDVDNFKEVNDSAGHEAGDRLLESVALTIKACVRTTDLVARLGGDEFAVLLPGADQNQARTVMENIRRRLKEGKDQAGQMTLTLSVGAVTCTGSCGLQKAIKEADKAMYRAKKNGKDRIEFKVGYD